MKITIGEPEHGWTDVSIIAGEFALNDSISDVPCDFIQQSVLALSRLLTNDVRQKIELSLEPGFYTLDLSRCKQKFSLTIKRSDSGERYRTLFETVGDFDEIIHPLYRAIKEFYSHGYQDPNWPECNDADLKSLEEAVNQYKHRAKKT